jgi:glycerol-3-phosphate dehydrogenase
MAKDVLDTVIKKGLLPPSSSQTKNILIHGATINNDNSLLAVYGTDAEKIKELQKENPWNEQLVEGMPHTKAEVAWCIRNEMARTIEDVLARRLRILFLNAEIAIQAAPVVAEILKTELQQTEEWKQKQLHDFFALAKRYLP